MKTLFGMHGKLSSTRSYNLSCHDWNMIGDRSFALNDIMFIKRRNKRTGLIDRLIREADDIYLGQQHFPIPWRFKK